MLSSNINSFRFDKPLGIKVSGYWYTSAFMKNHMKITSLKIVICKYRVNRVFQKSLLVLNYTEWDFHSVIVSKTTMYVMFIQWCIQVSNTNTAYSTILKTLNYLFLISMLSLNIRFVGEGGMVLWFNPAGSSGCSEHPLAACPLSPVGVAKELGK